MRRNHRAGRRRVALETLLLIPLAALVARGQDQEQPPQDPAQIQERYVAYTPSRRTFSCEVPPSWPSFEEDTPSGSAAHLLGPVQADGAWRAAIHVHYMQKGTPGFIPVEEALKRERASDKNTEREASPLFRWRVGRYPARRFEVVETRQLPGARLPAKSVVLHHYYAIMPAGEGYFILKLSTTRDDYLDYRNIFDHLLGTFRVLAAS